MRDVLYKRVLIMGLCMVAVYFIMYSRTCSINNGTLSPQLANKQDKSIYTPDDTNHNISDTSIIIYRSYVNLQGYIRILAISRCLPTNYSLTLQSNNYVSSSSISLRSVPIEQKCPWEWAPGCLYNAYMFEEKLPSSATFDGKGVISAGTRSTTVHMERTRKRKDGELSLCVPPFYWYTDWTKLIVFIEWWTAQGANQFFIYFHSASKDVKTVLDFYQSKGLITLIMWPLLPSSSEIDPNKSIYRLSHSLAHNDCVNRIETEFGALVDIDEIIFARNSTITWFIRQKFSLRPFLGSLSFTHRVLLYKPTLTPTSFSFDDLDFQGIMDATELTIEGPKKTTTVLALGFLMEIEFFPVIFRSDAVRRLSTHRVIDFYGSRWTTKIVSPNDAVLLHNRYNHNSGDSESKGSKANLMQDLLMLEQFRKELVKRKTEIFANGAHFKSTTQVALGACLASWRKDHNNCKSPVLGCESVMRGLEEWITAEDDIYLIL